MTGPGNLQVIGFVSNYMFCQLIMGHLFLRIILSYRLLSQDLVEPGDSLRIAFGHREVVCP